MENGHKAAQAGLPGKKEMRKQLADKISAAIPELQLTLGEKKFHHRIKKAVKLITEGLHKKEANDAVKKIKQAGKKVAVPKAGKKAKAAKKAAVS